MKFIDILIVIFDSKYRTNSKSSTTSRDFGNTSDATGKQKNK